MYHIINKLHRLEYVCGITPIVTAQVPYKSFWDMCCRVSRQGEWEMDWDKTGNISANLFKDGCFFFISVNTVSYLFYRNHCKDANNGKNGKSLGI